jgi:CheY-like chemotaxis protein
MTDLVLNTDLTPEQRNYLNDAKVYADLLLTMVSDLLEFSELEAGQLDLEEQDLELSALVEKTGEMMTPLARQKGLDISWDIAPELPSAVRGDARRIRQILSNLISNAVRFTKEGEINVSVAAESADQEKVRFRFSVRDTGIGIPQDKQQIIFQAFQQADSSLTREYGGIGLGLTVAQQLVGLMNGRIWVESTVGKGSTFYFTVQLELQQDVAPPPAHDVGPLQILLAEDSPTNQLIAVATLKKAGHTVHVVDNGVKAVEASAEGGFDLILMDVAMPEMDGMDATIAIREREKRTGLHIPIIAMTAFTMKGFREKCLAAGMDTYVSKPVSPDELQRTIGPLLAREKKRRLETEIETPSIDELDPEPDSAAPPSEMAPESPSKSPTIAEPKVAEDDALLQPEELQPEEPAATPPPAAEPEAASDPPVDLEAALEIVGDDVDILEMVVEMFQEEYTDLLEALEGALEQEDAAGVEATAHKIKGVLGNVGSGPARNHGQTLETMGVELNLSGGMDTFIELKRETERVVAFYSQPEWMQDAAAILGEG